MGYDPSKSTINMIFVHETRGRSIHGSIIVRNAAQGGTRGRKRRNMPSYMRGRRAREETRSSLCLVRSTYLYTSVVVFPHPRRDDALL